ncbi:MAG: hypothetical protein KF878_13305 [Planctomycetes bacterium]|nr:hypothetical protein [Planctomycetota bacterium]
MSSRLASPTEGPAPATAQAWREAGARLTAAPGLAIVLLLGGAAAWGNRGQVNPDGVSYLQLASYLAGGDVVASISAYWNPLLVWLLAPLLGLGLDRLVTARLALLLCAAVGVLAADRLALRLGLRPLPRAAAVAAVAAPLAELATRVITPDVLVGACLLAYTASACHPRLLRCRRRAALTGALGGVCFLAKSYALPFVLVHLPLMIGLRAWRERDVDRRDAARALAVALAALLAIASAWIVVLSVRFQRPTWATSGASVHAAVGPGAPLGDYRMPTGLMTPPPPHRSVWEMPELLAYPAWSPLATPEHRAHQAAIIAHHGASALRILRGWDWLGLTLPGLALAPLLAWLARRRLERDAPALAAASLWVPATVAIYIGGHLPIFLEERYLLTFLLPLAALLLVAWAAAAAAAFRDRARAGPAVGALLVGLVCAAYALGPARALVDRARRGDDGQRFAALVSALREARVSGPLALVVEAGEDPHAWHSGHYAAFFLDETYVGTLTLAEATGTDLLDRHAVGAVLVPRADASPADLGPGWALRCVLGGPGGRRLEVFGRR